jgi:hypothetical protein
MRFIAVILAMFAFAAAPATERGVRFTTVEVRIDPKGVPLAAYQVEFVADESVKLVGIEGGEHAAFKIPPYYDPAALSNHRVIIAAFNTSGDLPKSETRVARLHVQISGGNGGNVEQTPDWTVKLMVASSADGKAIAGATAKLVEGTLVEGAGQ